MLRRITLVRSMTAEINPYRPTSGTPRNQPIKPGPSTWGRNFAASLSITLASCLIAIGFEVAGHSTQPLITVFLLVVAFLVSTWANFHVAARIGLRQGGMPVMFVLVFGWAIAYFLQAMLGIGIIESVFDSL